MAQIRDDGSLVEAELALFLTEREIAACRLKKDSPARRNWLLGRLAVKAAAYRRWWFDPDRLAIINNEAGAPELMVNGRPKTTRSISISHTSGAAVGAVAENPVGVDLERWERPLSPQLIDWAFSESERRLALAPSGQEWPAGLALWCAREAAAKAWGIPLLNHLAQVRVKATDWASGQLTVAGPGWVERVAVSRSGESGDYLLAVAGTGRRPTADKHK
ncbi:MAG: 4'-phosphopantetheinyl transferase superfamily protein [Candidatus Adiutrix sp.]|nr:4'-phosphopantetheinyl transferase superfamily protein [Candidatus Adiutrix sp.]